MARLLLLALLIGSLAGCSDPTPTGGIEGMVWVGPTCPVMQDPPKDECGDKPLATELKATPKSGPSATFVSEANGKFKVALPPGTYSITRPGQTPPSCQLDGVVVVAQQYSLVEVHCDSGIR